jgi:uncharacterized protein YyaL (SSP411 family)
VLCGALTSYAALAGSTPHRRAAERALAALGGLLPRHARFAGWTAAVGEALLAGPLEVAVVTPHPDDDPLVRAAWRGTSPGAVVVTGAPNASGVPLLADRPYLDGAPAAYVCREFVCDRPTTDPQDLARRMGARIVP